MPKVYLLLLIILTLALELGFLPGLESRLPLILNLPLLLLVLAVFFVKTDEALSLALLLGLFFDLYSPYFFGFYLIIFSLLVIILKLIITRLFEHKKLLSFLAINLLAIFFWQICLLLARLIATRFFDQSSLAFFPPNFFGFFLLEIILHSLLIISFYKMLPFFKAQFTGDLIT